MTGSRCSAPLIRKKLTRAITNAAATTPGPTSVGICFRSGARNAVRPLTTKPVNGRSRIAQSSVGSKLTLSPQQVEVLDVDRFQVPEDRDNDREPDRGLGRGNGHDEEHEHLAFDPDRSGERHE